MDLDCIYNLYIVDVVILFPPKHRSVQVVLPLSVGS